jgi:hypothetical protein
MNAPADPAFAQRCRESFGRQKAMALGYVHGGIVGMIADTGSW